jgi:hypothetical protein
MQSVMCVPDFNDCADDAARAMLDRNPFQFSAYLPNQAHLMHF